MCVLVEGLALQASEHVEQDLCPFWLFWAQRQLPFCSAEVGQAQAFQELGVFGQADLGSLFCSAYRALACRPPLGEAGWILLVWPRARLVA